MPLPFTIVIPTYNEAAGIAKLLGALDATFREHGLDGEIIVVDDNSPDGTGKVVEQLSQRYPVRCLHRSGKLGLSSAVIEGWGMARKESVALGAMDADFSHDPSAFPKMVAALESGEYGLAVGSRYVPGGSTPGWPWQRRALSKYGNRYTAAVLKLGIRDATGGFRAYRAATLEKTISAENP